MTAGKWDARIQRANGLASSYPFASQGLRFYARLARFQESLYAEIETQCGTAKEKRLSGTLRDEFDVFVLLPRFVRFVSRIEEIAPPPLASAAHEVGLRNAAHWQNILRTFWENISSPVHPEPAEGLLAWLFLQPYAEYLADHSEWSPRSGTVPTCPLCEGKPQVGVLRPEGAGGKRSLICSLCAMEWDYGRIACASCGEEDPEKLAVYVADGFAHVRVEACDTCRRYIKTVDLTKNGHAVPVVDELAMIPLDLWATEHRYHKTHPNLLGL